MSIPSPLSRVSEGEFGTAHSRAGEEGTLLGDPVHQGQVTASSLVEGLGAVFVCRNV